MLGELPATVEEDHRRGKRLMTNRKTTDVQLNLVFSRPEDLRLHEFLKKKAYEARYSISTFILLSLQQAFQGQIDEEEVNAVAQEALSKVRARTAEPSQPTPVPETTPASPMPTLTPELEESIRAKIAARTTKKR
jgi:hypothetical protein